MEIFETIKKRRSCRHFDIKEVENEKIQAILEAGGWAPSNLNSQPWRFIVVRNAEVKNQIKDIAEEAKQYLMEKHCVKWLKHYPLDFLDQAPVFIAVTADPDKAGPDRYLQEKAISHMFSCCAAIQNMLLVAHSLGLGSLWFSLFDREPVKNLLNIDEKMELIALVLIGYPASAPKDIQRKPVMEFVTEI